MSGRFTSFADRRNRIRCAALLGWALLAANAADVAADVPPKPPGPVVMVHFDYYEKDKARLHALEQRLDRAVKQAGAGELGETELHRDGNDGYLYFYGASADRLYAVARPILKSSGWLTGTEVTLRREAGRKRSRCAGRRTLARMRVERRGWRSGRCGSRHAVRFTLAGVGDRLPRLRCDEASHVDSCPGDCTSRRSR